VGHERFSELPRGNIVALVVFDDVFSYDMCVSSFDVYSDHNIRRSVKFDATHCTDSNIHADLEWAFGPYCYRIIDVIRTSVSDNQFHFSFDVLPGTSRWLN